jgi:hypothetical protein
VDGAGAVIRGAGGGVSFGVSGTAGISAGGSGGAVAGRGGTLASLSGIAGIAGIEEGGGGGVAGVLGAAGVCLAIRPEGRLSVDCGGEDGGGSREDCGEDGVVPSRGDRSRLGSVGSGPSLSRTLRSTMTLGRLLPGAYT